MTDKEKVLKGIECCMILPGSCPEECPYREQGDETEYCDEKIIKDVYTLMKAQEPKLVHVTANINHRKLGECPTCGKSINSGDYPNYCGRCGQAVKWE